MTSSESIGFATALQHHEGPIVVVELVGEVDVFAAPDLRAALEPLLEDDVDVCLDLTAAPFLDTTALSILLHARRRVRDRGGQFVLAGAGTIVAASLDQAGLGDLLPRYPDLQEALAALRD
ncbi:MAG: anti-sigma factor antagonist [Solirubrobacteraceae bacterium]|nr:anti-sigma factor antagonist [Solirubrobacteraceae bacterium]